MRFSGTSVCHTYSKCWGWVWVFPQLRKCWSGRQLPSLPHHRSIWNISSPITLTQNFFLRTFDSVPTRNLKVFFKMFDMSLLITSIILSLVQVDTKNMVHINKIPWQKNKKSNHNKRTRSMYWWFSFKILWTLFAEYILIQLRVSRHTQYTSPPSSRSTVWFPLYLWLLLLPLVNYRGSGINHQRLIEKFPER